MNYILFKTNVINTQDSSLLNCLPVLSALEIIYIYGICMVELPHMVATSLEASQLHAQRHHFSNL